MSDKTTPLSPTEGSGRTHSTGDSGDIDDLRSMIESMKEEFSCKLENVTHRAEIAEMRAAQMESEMELTGVASGGSKVTRRVPKGAVGGATGGARPKSSYFHGPTPSEQELERGKAMSDVGHMTGGTTVPKSTFPLTPQSSTGGPSGPWEAHAVVVLHSIL